MAERAANERSGELFALYFQATLGHAHRARVRRLDATPGIRCVGVQYADRERTRAPEAADRTPMHTLAEGVYENLPRSRRVWSALRYARSVRPDAAIIDCPADAAQFATGRALQQLGVATLVRWASTREDYARHAWKELLKRPAYAGWDGYLATGTRAAQYIESFGVPSGRIFVCGNPVDDEQFDALRTQTPIPREDCFLFAGRFIWHKNLLGLLDAYALYRARGGTFALEIAGGGAGKDAERFVARAARTPGVRLLGFLGAPELAGAYARASCLVLPSLSENWGLVVNEAMLAGLPVVVSDRCGCVPELVSDGENGFVVDPESADGLAQALARIEALGSARRAAMGAGSRERVATQSAELWAERVASALRATCASRARRA